MEIEPVRQGDAMHKCPVTRKAVMRTESVKKGNVSKVPGSDATATATADHLRGLWLDPTVAQFCAMQQASCLPPPPPGKHGRTRTPYVQPGTMLATKQWLQQTKPQNTMMMQ
jgi:hypothetical protein